MHNLAIIGCGYWGPNLVRNFRALPGVKVCAICDKNLERLNHVGQLYPDVDRTKDAARIANDPSIDMVAIATPVFTHHPLATECLRNGKHVFVEKPLARSTKECMEMIRLAEEKALTLMVGHTFVYTQTVRRIKEIVDSGEIGDVMYVSCRRLNLGLFQKDINVAWDLAPHDISIILYILGKVPVAVNCQGKSHVSPNVEDVTNISLTFPNGMFAMIQSSWIDPRKVREITIIGTKKMIVYDDTAPLEKIKIYDKRVQAPPHYDTFGEFQYSYHYGDILSPYVQEIEPLKVECQHFIDCVDKGKRPDSSGYDGLTVVQILEAATASLMHGGNTIPLEHSP
jgi:predicted dehydrogenase